AISSSFHPDDHTHVQICKYPDGSGLMARLAWPAAPGGRPPLLRAIHGLLSGIRRPVKLLRLLWGVKVMESGVFFLVMQSLDSSLTFRWRPWIRSLRLTTGTGANVPSWIPAGQKTMDLYSRKSGGIPLNCVTEVFLGTATTAHILGGCPMGRTGAEGVVDDRFRLHGYDNFLVLDGSIIPGNLGVNPSLTITALAEWAMEQVAPPPAAG
ncbi:MAG: cholesterol oxidase, partial [Bdellovibrionales bacterium]|nr:cholesterol oxidase [Bdellovibrionales bacterium]